jgi:sugar (pentulose or hexulose) kinase
MYDDASSRAEAAKIALTAPPESPVHGPSSSLAKALALQGRLGTGRARTLAHQADWLNGCLTGRFGLSDPNNCLKLGYDSQEGRWPDWLVSLPLPSLPNVKTRGSLLGGVTRAAAEETGLPAGTPVFTGTTDSTAACLAAGLEQPGQALTVLGSTLVLKVLSARPLNAPGYGVYSHPFGRAWLVGGASNSGGNVLEKFFSREEMAELTGGVDPEHLVRLGYYPLVNPGERFPVNDPQWMPRLAPRPGDPAKFFQALLEGIAEIERRGYRLLGSLGAPAPVEVITIGGGARNPAWQAIRERLLGLPVRCALHEEPAYGSALLAREGALARQR